MAIALVPFVVAVIGALIYAFASNAKLAEIGRILFSVGALWCVYVVLGVHVRIG